MILVLVTGIQLNGQTISIKTKLFDFFAGEAISAKGLRQDTAILNSVIKKKDSTNGVLKSNINMLNVGHVIDSTSKASFKQQSEKCSDKLEKKEKNNDRLWKVIFGAIVIEAIEATVIYFSVIKK